MYACFIHWCIKFTNGSTGTSAIVTGAVSLSRMIIRWCEYSFEDNVLWSTLFSQLVARKIAQDASRSLEWRFSKGEFVSIKRRHVSIIWVLLILNIIRSRRNLTMLHRVNFFNTIAEIVRDDERPKHRIFEEISVRIREGLMRGTSLSDRHDDSLFSNSYKTENCQRILLFCILGKGRNILRTTWFISPEWSINLINLLGNLLHEDEINYRGAWIHSCLE